MARHISNMKDLERALIPTMAKMVDRLAERVYETLNYFLQDYYADDKPSSYQRSKDFLFSAVKVNAEPYRKNSIAPNMAVLK